MTNPYRALCANLTAALNDWQCETGDDRYEGLLDHARALLAEAVAEGPTDEELEEEFGAALLKLSGDSMNATAVDYARAVLDRWGRPTPQPVPDPGEVADEDLREIAMHCINGHKSIEWAIKKGIALDRSRRAAELLSQRHPNPVPVSERLPGPSANALPTPEAL